MANAKFKITGDPSVNRGYDASHSDVLQLQLEDQPSADVYKCEYKIGRATAGAPTPTFSPSNGVASPSNGVVELTMPGSGVHLYEVICTVNGGTDDNGQKRPEYTFSRIVAIRSANGFRKILAAETVEYDPNEGWAAAFNELAEFITLTPPLISTIEGTLPVVVDDTDPANLVVSINAATTSLPGSMSATDKSKLDAMGAGATVAGITGTAPITITGTAANPIVNIVASTGSVPGSMSAADKTLIDGATNAATASTLVKRDASGNASFAAVFAQTIDTPGTNLVLAADSTITITLDIDTTNEILMSSAVRAPEYKLASAVTNLYRSAPLDWRGAIVSGSESWVPTSTGTAKQDVIDAGAELFVQLDPLHASVLTNVRFNTHGAGLISDPDAATMPTYSVIRQHVETLVETVTGTGPDGAAAVGGDYRASHWTEITCGSHVVDRVNYRYYAKLTPEHGSDSQVGFQLDSVMIGYDLPAGFVIGMN